MSFSNTVLMVFSILMAVVGFYAVHLAFPTSGDIPDEMLIPTYPRRAARTGATEDWSPLRELNTADLFNTAETPLPQTRQERLAESHSYAAALDRIESNLCTGLGNVVRQALAQLNPDGATLMRLLGDQGGSLLRNGDTIQFTTVTTIGPN